MGNLCNEHFNVCLMLFEVKVKSKTLPPVGGKVIGVDSSELQSVRFISSAAA